MEFYGGEGDDYLTGTNGSDTLDGSGGDDIIFGGDGLDELRRGDLAAGEEDDDEAMGAFVPMAPFTIRCCTCGGYQAPSLWQRMRRWLRGRRAHH